MLRPKGMLVVGVALCLLGCPGQRPAATVAPKPKASKPAPAQAVRWQMSKSGLGFRLSNAESEPVPRPKLAPALPLSKADRAKVVRRMPPLAAHAKRAGFALREKSMPPPRPGETIRSAFPPPPGVPPAPASARGALTISRFAPEGEVELAPSLSVTFSQPMVPITAHHELGAAQVPVRLSPQPPGKWRWVGTQTLLFEPDHERFPMATEYSVELPAGTRSETGGTLAATKAWKFSTPELRIEDQYPTQWSGPSDLEPLVFARFNQRIDRQSVLANVALRAAKQTRTIRLATQDEIEKDEQVRGRTRGLEPDRYIVVRPTERLPKDTSIEVTLERGAASAEGPRRTAKAQSIPFRTYGPLAIVDATCGWSEGCPPLAAWNIRLNNPIDLTKFDRSLLKVEPALPDMKADVSGNEITIRGRSKGRTKYRVTLGPELADTFGQTLEKPATREIEVDSAEPMLFPEQDPMVVLDPAFEPKLSVYSVNRPSLRVRLYAVSPDDWALYAKYRRDWNEDEKISEPPGKLVQSRELRPRRAPDELVETQIDLAPALTNGFGQVVAIVEPPAQPKSEGWRWQREWVRTWVQVTKIGLGAFVDHDTAWAWTTRLGDGAPLADVDVSVLSGPGARTKSDGIASFRLGAKGELLVAKHKGDLVFLPGANLEGSFAARPPEDSIAWFVFDDRGLYKPGERINAKGWVRVTGSGKRGDIQKLPRSLATTIDYEIYEPSGNEFAKGRTALDPDGGFSLSASIPKNVNLGQARIRFDLGRFAGSEHEYDHGFEIEEFRRPEFEVTAETTQGPHFVGNHAIATVSASYYAGGGLGNSAALWTVIARDAYFAPPNRPGWQFGKPQRWSWWNRDETERVATEDWPAKTGPDGKHRLRIDFDALEPAYPRQLALEATVTDVNRQSWTARSELLVHPANVTVGLRTDARLLAAGQTIALDAIVTDIDGKTVGGRHVDLKSARIETTWRNDHAIERELEIEHCALESGAEPVRCSLPTRRGGLHRVTAIVTDVHGRKSQTELELWVLGDEPPQSPELQRGQVELLPDKPEYRAGDLAELLVIAPFAPAEGVLSLRRGGLVRLERFSLKRRSEKLKVPLDRAWLPNVVARVDLVGSVERENERGDPDPSLPRRPAFARGEVTLKIPPLDRSLSIDVVPAHKHVEPGGKTRVSIKVKDARGQPVPGANLALIVVDESVLALAGYELPNPIEAFYATRPADVEDYETRLRVALARPDTARMQLRAKESQVLQKKVPMATSGGSHGRLAGAASAGPVRVRLESARIMIGAKPPSPAPKAEPAEAEKRAPKPEKPAAPITVRRDFSALATFVPRIVTDGSGRAQIPVKLPDNLTRYRVMAVAAAGDNRFGSAESAVTARLPLMVRPSFPRFLNFGDRFSLPVVLQNQTSKPLSVDVAVRADNARLLDPSGLRVTVPASDRVEVRFPTQAGTPGSARFQLAALSGELSDAAEGELPIWTPATTEAFATYGQVDRGAVAQKIKIPGGVFTEFGGLEITTSSSALQGLTDAVLYLVRYPFECNEQISSRVLGIAALKDVLGAFGAEAMPTPKELSGFVAKDVEKLAGRQHWSGGWDWWSKDHEPSPFVSVHVTHALVVAKSKGFELPPELLPRALAYVRNIRAHFAHNHPDWVRREIESYALYVRALEGDRAAGDARRVIREAGGVDRLSLDALGWLLVVLSPDAGSKPDVEAIRRRLDNRVTETAGKAQFTTSHELDGAHLVLSSSRRTDGILLEAMIADRPESDLIPKLVAGLLGHRKRGRWLNTQENVFILLALDRYFQKYEQATPDFLARAWLGDGMTLEHRFRGRSVDRQQAQVPLSYLASKQQPLDFVVSKDGTGRLYYRVGMQYAPRNLQPPPAEHGFSVTRRYEPVDKPGDVRHEPDGSWRIKAGALVRVRITMLAPARRTHVALVDPLPAGLEPLNPALATTQSIPEDPAHVDPKRPWWWSSAWYEHQNMRDERVEAFASLLWEGVYDYTYVARATTPGEFVVPPPKAEEMYDPETFGRGASDRVIVE